MKETTYTYKNHEVTIEPHMLNLYAEVRKDGKIVMSGACGMTIESAKEKINGLIDKKEE